MNNIDGTLYDLHARLARTEESNTALSAKCAYLSENLARCQQWNNDLTQIVMKLIPEQDSQVYRDASAIQKDITRHYEANRAHEDTHEPSRQPYYGQMNADSIPLSPRQAGHDERRPSFHGPPGRSTFFRPPAPHAVVPPPRRYGSIGNAAHLPSYHHRPSINVPPPHTPTHQQHPLASVTEPGQGSGPSLARRHTSADIRDTAGWPPQGPGQGSERGPFDTTQPPPPGSGPQWPPSPSARPDPQAQHIRDTLGSYEFGQPRRRSVVDVRSRGASPPPPHLDPSAPHPPPPPIQGPFQENGWSFASATASKNLAPRFPPGDSAPATRRSSMASNVHNLLNPTADTDPKDRGDDDAAPEERNKRKRVA
jgi:hypothetical protein